MSKNKQLTFAQRAAQIEKKYTRAKTDPIEKRDLEQELNTLMEEQEAYREANGMNQPQGQPQMPQQEFGDGGRMMYPDGGYPYSSQIDSLLSQKPIPSNLLPTRESIIPNIPKDYTSGEFSLETPNIQLGQRDSILPSMMDTLSYKQGNLSPQRQNYTPPNKPLMYKSGNNSYVDDLRYTDLDTRSIKSQIPALNQRLENSKLQEYAANKKAAGETMQTALDGEEGAFWDKNKQYLPYAISGASNIIGNLLMANKAKKLASQNKISPRMATPEMINLEPQAQGYREQAQTSKNINMRNARNLGLGKGATMANIGAANTGIDRGLGQNLTNLYMQQEGANVGAANQFNLANMQNATRADMTNAQIGQQEAENQLGYLSGALGTIPGVTKDIRMDKADKEMRDITSAYYKSMGRNYMNEGDVFDKDGFRYTVRNNRLVKTGKSK